MSKSRLIGDYPVIGIRFGMDKEAADYRACENFGPLFKNTK